MASYDDMMGLAMYDGDGLGAYMDPEMLKAALMTGAVGGVGILATGTVLGYVDSWLPEEWSPMARSRTKNAIAVLIGVVGGRMIYGSGMDMRRRDSAMGFTGAVAGLGLANLVASWVNREGEEPMVRTNFAGGHLSGASLAQLEAAVASTSPAWRPSYDMAGTVAQSRELSAPVVSANELGNYAPYLS